MKIPRPKPLTVAITGLILIGASWAWITWWTQGLDAASDSADAIARLGQRGDHFGSLNAIFTGLGFVALVYTILLQIQELEESRQANARQSREAFLAARINAAVAVLESLDRDDSIAIQASDLPENDSQHAITSWAYKRFTVFEKSSLLQYIKILSFESRLAMDIERGKSVECKAVFDYLASSFDFARATTYSMYDRYGRTAEKVNGEPNLDFVFLRQFISYLDVHINSISLHLTSQPFEDALEVAKIAHIYADIISDLFDKLKEAESPNDIARVCWQINQCLDSASTIMMISSQDLDEDTSMRPWSRPIRSVLRSPLSNTSFETISR